MAKLTEIPHLVSERIMSMRIPLTTDQNATIVSAYTPTMDHPEDNKETFCSQLIGYTHKHSQYLQAHADRRLQCKDRKRK